MKNIWLLLFFLGIAVIHAEETEPPAFPNRVLFIVEKSSDMKRAADATRETIAQLIESGAQQQLKAGDTFGLWAFNEKFNTDYPMQRWEPGNAVQLATAATNFLEKIRFEKKGKLGAFWPGLTSVIENSKAVTVILLSTGADPIHGTPFDSRINTTYANYARELRNAKLVFVTSLVARNGKIVAFAVNSSLSIQIPKVAPPAPPRKVNLFPETNAVSTVTNVVEPPKRYAKHNIIITKSTTNPPVTTSVETNHVETKPVSVTNSAATAISSNSVLRTNVESTISTNAPVAKTPNVAAEISTNVKPENATSIAINSVQEKTNSVAPQIATVTNSVVVTNAVTITNVVKVTNELTPQKTLAMSPVSMEAQKPRSSRVFVLIGAALVLIAAALIFFVVRNSKKGNTSLISRSMDK